MDVSSLKSPPYQNPFKLNDSPSNICELWETKEKGFAKKSLSSKMSKNGPHVVRGLWKALKKLGLIVLSAIIFTSKFLTFNIQYLIFEYSKKRFAITVVTSSPVK